MGIFDEMLPSIAKGIFVVSILLILGAAVMGTLHEQTTEQLSNDTNINNVYNELSESMEDFAGYLPLFVILAIVMVAMLAIGMRGM